MAVPVFTAEPGDAVIVENITMENSEWTQEKREKYIQHVYIFSSCITILMILVLILSFGSLIILIKVENDPHINNTTTNGTLKITPSYIKVYLSLSIIIGFYMGMFSTKYLRYLGYFLRMLKNSESDEKLNNEKASLLSDLWFAGLPPLLNFILNITISVIFWSSNHYLIPFNIKYWMYARIIISNIFLCLV
jgi:hypothetical protein